MSVLQSREATLVKINCMAVSTAAKAFAVLAEELLGASTPADQDAAARLQARFTDASAPMAYVGTGTTPRGLLGVVLKFDRGALPSAGYGFLVPQAGGARRSRLPDDEGPGRAVPHV